MILEMSVNQKKSSEEAKEDINLVIERQNIMEKRITKLKTRGAAQGEHSFIEQHKLLLNKSRYGIKVLKMRGEVSEKKCKSTPGNTA